MSTKKDDSAVFAENIKLFRNSVGISQKELADLANVTQANVSQWESGLIAPPVKIIQLIKKNFPKVNAEWFFTEPVQGKDFRGDKLHQRIKSLEHDLSAKDKELNSCFKTVKELNREIDQMKDQISVLTALAKTKLKA